MPTADAKLQQVAAWIFNSPEKTVSAPMVFQPHLKIKQLFKTAPRKYGQLMAHQLSQI